VADDPDFRRHAVVMVAEAEFDDHGDDPAILRDILRRLDSLVSDGAPDEALIHVVERLRRDIEEALP